MGGQADRLGGRRQQHGEQLDRGGPGARVRAAAAVPGGSRAEPPDLRPRQGGGGVHLDHGGTRGGDRRRPRGEHGRVGLDGTGGGRRSAAQRIPGLPCGPRSHEARRSEGHFPALPPGAPWRRRGERGARGPAGAGVGRGGEPAARPEGSSRHAAGRMKRTALHEIHVALGAKMVPFGGFEMPVSYPSGIAAEHRAVRERVGVFDVSHMGEFEVSGPDRNAFVQRATCNDVGALKPGQAQYSALLTEQGTFVDDCLVYRFEDRLMLVVNAANIATDWAHVVAQKRGANVRLRDISDATALLAVQGPGAEALLAALTPIGVAMIPYYQFVEGKLASVQCFISRTGYTGEDGFELYCRASDAETLWHALVGAGRAEPCGLGARATLRLRAGRPPS